MRTLAFDGATGASGDMLLGALLAVGADRAALAPVEAALDLEYRVDRTTKRGIAATTVDVIVDGEAEHAVDDDHHSHHRHYGEVREIVSSMDLPGTVESDALATIERLGEAEAIVHDTDLESVHFHEVGADDAIADVVGVAALIRDLDVERVVTTPVAAGGGTMTMSHGTYPVPAPAVVEIAEDADWELRGGPVDRELLTPTGAALLAHFADGVDHLPSMRVERSGYGAGTIDLDAHANVLRATVGETTGGLRKEPITVLETNVDDVSPEVLGNLHETLGEAGAKDVYVTPATMKKSRPGHTVTVIADPADSERLARSLAEETGTLGVRDRGVEHRWVADRRFETVAVEFGGEEYSVQVKIASEEGGEVFDVSAEYEDAKRVAREADVPVRDVLTRAETAGRTLLE
jgi:uncharacterized protein (TIGR00299 family) protein